MDLTQLQNNVNKFIDPEIDSEEQQESFDYINNLLVGSSDHKPTIAIQDIIHFLEDALTSTIEKRRHRGTLLLAELLHANPNMSLSAAVIHLLVVFFNQRLSDYPSIVPALHALLALVKYHTQSFDPKYLDYLDIFQTIFKSVDVQSYAQTIRQSVFELFYDMFQYPSMLSSCQSHAAEIIDGIFIVFEGEKDPRCLSIAFPMITLTMTLFTDSIGIYAERIYDILTAYFPIIFIPPPDDPYGITPEQLVTSLQSCFLAHKGLLSYILPYFIDQLFTCDEELGKIHALDILSAGCIRYGIFILLEYHLSPTSSQPVISRLIEALLEFLFESGSIEIKTRTIYFIYEISSLIGRAESSRHMELWNKFNQKIVDKCIFILYENIDTNKAKECWTLLCIMSSSSLISSQYIVKQVISLIILKLNHDISLDQDYDSIVVDDTMRKLYGERLHTLTHICASIAAGSVTNHTPITPNITTPELISVNQQRIFSSLYTGYRTCYVYIPIRGQLYDLSLPHAVYTITAKYYTMNPLNEHLDSLLPILRYWIQYIDNILSTTIQSTSAVEKSVYINSSILNQETSNIVVNVLRLIAITFTRFDPNHTDVISAQIKHTVQTITRLYLYLCTMRPGSTTTTIITSPSKDNTTSTDASIVNLEEACQQCLSTLILLIDYQTIMKECCIQYILDILTNTQKNHVITWSDKKKASHLLSTLCQQLLLFSTNRRSIELVQYVYHTCNTQLDSLQKIHESHIHEMTKIQDIQEICLLFNTLSNILISDDAYILLWKSNISVWLPTTPMYSYIQYLCGLSTSIHLSTMDNKESSQEEDVYKDGYGNTENTNGMEIDSIQLKMTDETETISTTTTAGGGERSNNSSSSSILSQWMIYIISLLKSIHGSMNPTNLDTILEMSHQLHMITSTLLTRSIIALKSDDQNLLYIQIMPYISLLIQEYSAESSTSSLPHNKYLYQSIIISILSSLIKYMNKDCIFFVLKEEDCKSYEKESTKPLNSSSSSTLYLQILEYIYTSLYSTCTTVFSEGINGVEDSLLIAYKDLYTSQLYPLIFLLFNKVKRSTPESSINHLLDKKLYLYFQLGISVMYTSCMKIEHSIYSTKEHKDAIWTLMVSYILWLSKSILIRPMMKLSVDFMTHWKMIDTCYGINIEFPNYLVRLYLDKKPMTWQDIVSQILLDFMISPHKLSGEISLKVDKTLTGCLDEYTSNQTIFSKISTIFISYVYILLHSNDHAERSSTDDVLPTHKTHCSTNCDHSHHKHRQSSSGSNIKGSSSSADTSLNQAVVLKNIAIISDPIYCSLQYNSFWKQKLWLKMIALMDTYNATTVANADMKIHDKSMYEEETLCLIICSFVSYLPSNLIVDKLIDIIRITIKSLLLSVQSIFNHEYIKLSMLYEFDPEDLSRTVTQSNDIAYVVAMGDVSVTGHLSHYMSQGVQFMMVDPSDTSLKGYEYQLHYQSLVTLNRLIQDNVRVIAEYVTTLTPILLLIARYHTDMKARLLALSLIQYLSQLSYHMIHPVKIQVLKQLGYVLNDKKRAVRLLGAKVRNTWYILHS